MFVTVRTPAPILNTPDFRFAFGGMTGNEIPLNEKGLPYCFEFVALQGTALEILERIPQEFGSIDRVAYAHYPYAPLYIDSRFTEIWAPRTNISSLSHKMPMEASALPNPTEVLRRMKQKIGTPYVWGGNWSRGIPELVDYYPPRGNIEPATHILWTLQGIDCSGLLYEAADGTTPRNTSELRKLATPVPIGETLKPLDMILYPGHVIFIQDEDTTIESKYPWGVIQRGLKAQLNEIEQKRRRVNRWTAESNPETDYVISRLF